MNSPMLRDITLALLRIALGAAAIAQGLDYLVLSGIDESIGQASAAQVAVPAVMVWTVALVSLLAGALLAVGLLSSAASLLLIAVICWQGWAFAASQGWSALEFPLVATAALVVIVVFGPGRLSVDGILARVES